MGIGQTLDRVTEAYRTGGGVAFADYGPHMMHGQGAINRPAFTRDLVPSWIGAVDGLTERLNAGATIADLGSGVGWASIAMAGQLPGANVIGWDTDAKSIAAARRNAAEAGVAVRFEPANAAAMDREGPFDLITILEALHDMSNPVEVLRKAWEVLAEGGLVLVADEKVAGGDGRAALGGDRHRHPGADRARAGESCRVRVVGNPGRRRRLLPAARPTQVASSITPGGAAGCGARAVRRRGARPPDRLRLAKALVRKGRGPLGAQAREGRIRPPLLTHCEAVVQKHYTPAGRPNSSEVYSQSAAASSSS